MISLLNEEAILNDFSDELQEKLKNSAIYNESIFTNFSFMQYYDIIQIKKYRIFI